ncbi:hypothetical protein EYR36_010009 [Pleurotus pulmonarius]|nr:hypothetical protein EYR36_010009 [Pleurotus pulmonarius]
MVMGSQRKQRKAPLGADPKPDTADDAQRELYLAEISHLRTRLLTTLDALDDLKTQHAHELHALTEERIKYHQQAKVYEQLWREAEAEKADMRDAVGELVEKAPMASLASPMVSSAHPNPYEASLITALRMDLLAEKSAHEETRHRFTLHISTLEAQLAFREAELEGCQRLLKADAAVHRPSADTNGSVNQPRAMSNGANVRYDYSTPDAVLRVLDAARAKSRSLEQDIKDISAKLERSRLSARNSTSNASLHASVPESRSKAVQTEHPPARELRHHSTEAGDVFEDALRLIEEKLDRSQVDLATKSAVHTISIQHPIAALRTDAAGPHPGDEETDEDATLRPTPLVLHVSRAAAAATVPHAPTILPFQAVVKPTAQRPLPPPASPSFTSAEAQADELPAATDTRGGAHSHLVEEFEKEVEALGRGVDALRTESGALLNGRRAVGTCHPPLPSPSQPHGQPNQHHHEQEERLAPDLLAPDDDYGEISMELATPLNPTVTLPLLPPLPPSPPLPPPSPHTAFLASLPPLPLSPSPPLLTTSPPSASPPPVLSTAPSPLTLPVDTVISVPSAGTPRSQTPPSIPSPSERTHSQLIPLPTLAPQAPPIRLDSASSLLPSTPPPPPSPPLRSIAPPPQREAPLTSVFPSPWLTPSLERSPNHSTELDDLQDGHLSGIPAIPGLPPLPQIRRDLGLDHSYDPHWEAGSSPSRSISPIRLSPYLGTAAPDTRAVIDELAQDSAAPASSPFPSPHPALSSPPSTANTSPPLYPEAEYTLQHLQRVEAELRETREALEADEDERLALQGVLDGLVWEVVGAGYGILGADGGGGGGGGGGGEVQG